MAFLAPVLRSTEALGFDTTNRIAQWQAHLPGPLASLSPDLFRALLVSFTAIILLTLLTTVLQARHPRSRVGRVPAGGVRRKRGTEGVTALLAGPSGVGKTSLFSALALHSVPSVHPSQRESESKITLTDSARQIRLIDTPGHPRIKDRIISEHVRSSDVVVFCLDAKEALRGGVGASTNTKEGSLIEAVDHLHQLLIQLAKARRSTKSSSSPPPTLVLLFTRADLSPHLTNVSLSASLSPEEEKRRSILLNRARTAVEMELGRRRAGMGYGARRTTKVGGMGQVTGGDAQRSIWSSFQSLLGLSSSNTASVDQQDDGDEDEELVDYVDWDVLERTINNGTTKDSHSTGTSLEKLDEDVVDQGRAICAFASVGKERGWEERPIEGLDGLRRLLAEL